MTIKKKKKYITLLKIFLNSVCGNTITEEKILTILHTRPIQWLLPGGI